MKLAAPLAMISISIVYFLVNIAYLAVVSKEEILGSGRIAAALFFVRLWGPQTERVSFTGFMYILISIFIFFHVFVIL